MKTTIPSWAGPAACLVGIAAGKSTVGLSSKRGLALISESPDSDLDLLTSENSPISWYYNWSPWPNQQVGDSAMYLPMLHGLDAVEDDEFESILGRSPASSTHLLTFNEPDGEQDTGGSAVSAEDAAEAYLEHIVPLRTGDGSSSRTWNISHPVVTGSGMGLEWLQKFNESCYDKDPDNGCPTDFVAVHWYGDFVGLQSWLGQLNDFYNPAGLAANSSSRLKFWITEMALPQQDADATVAMMNESVRYLDGLDYVEGYAWFGAFRADDSNEWTGDGVSLFDDDGGLTELGSEYLGGEDNGFGEGESGDAVSVRGGVLPAMAMAAVAVLFAVLG